jgi:hypothetical protein
VADQAEPRAELLAPYLHPYREFVPRIWSDAHMQRVGLVGGVSAVGGSLATAATGSVGWVMLGLIPAFVALMIFLRVTAEAALVVWRFSRPWDERSELGTVRLRRPHAAEADGSVLHDEFAVTVEDTGHLYVWRYTPLAVMDDAPAGEVVVPGRPRYAAAVVEQRPLDPDPAPAAEQLAEMQALAAQYEVRASDDARAAALDAGRRRELQAETSSTAAALKHLTGQQPGDRD